MGNICKKTNKSDIYVNEGYVAYLQEKTTLTMGEIRHLYNRFKYLAGGANYLTKNCLMLVPGMQTNPLNSLIINAIFGRKRKIRFVEFAQFLHIFKGQNDDLHKAPREEEKLELLFNMYNRSGSGAIQKDELFDIVHRMFCVELDYSEILKISEIIIAETNTTENDEIVFKDFCTSIKPLDIDTVLMLKIPEY